MKYTIKKEPEHFIVEEIDKNKKIWKINEKYYFDEKSSGSYLWCLLIKKSWDLNRIVRKISKILKISRNRIQFAGTKDKYALTSQLISIYDIKKEQIEKINIKDCKIIPLYYSNKKNYLGNLWGNHFIIKVFSDLKDLEIKNEFPNFFGLQRFGKDLKNPKIGKAIIKKDYKKACDLILSSNELGFVEKPIFDHLQKNKEDYLGALKKLPKNIITMYLHSYQSYLFNIFLFEVLKENVDIKYGQIFGYKSKIRNDIEKEILEKEGIGIEDFRIKDFKIKLKGDFRKCFEKPYNLKVEVFDQGYIFDFCLRKGAYATVFIDWIFEKDINKYINI